MFFSPDIILRRQWIRSSVAIDRCFQLLWSWTKVLWIRHNKTILFNVNALKNTFRISFSKRSPFVSKLFQLQFENKILPLKILVNLLSSWICIHCFHRKIPQLSLNSDSNGAKLWLVHWNAWSHQLYFQTRPCLPQTREKRNSPQVN